MHHYTQISESVQYARLFRLFAVTGPYDDTDVRETHAVSAMKQWLGLQEPVPPTQCAIEDMTEATMNFLGQVLQLGYKIAGRSTLEHKVPQLGYKIAGRSTEGGQGTISRRGLLRNAMCHQCCHRFMVLCRFNMLASTGEQHTSRMRGSRWRQAQAGRHQPLAHPLRSTHMYDSMQIKHLDMLVSLHHRSRRRRRVGGNVYLL